MMGSHEDPEHRDFNATKQECMCSPIAMFSRHLPNQRIEIIVQGTGIVTKMVRDAVARIKKEPVLSALVGASKYPEFTQGSSGNENWHSWLKRTIPVLGGLRTYFMLTILLAWAQMRFNEAVLAKRKAKETADKKASGELESDREQSLRQEMAAAFKAAATAPSTRRAHHPYMREEHDLTSMKAMGFVQAGKSSAGSAWSEGEVDTMLQCLADLHSGAEAVHVQDPSYFLAHHGLLRQKTTAQVRALLQYTDRKYGI